MTTPFRSEIGLGLDRSLYNSGQIVLKRFVDLSRKWILAAALGALAAGCASSSPGPVPPPSPKPPPVSQPPPIHGTTVYPTFLADTASSYFTVTQNVNTNVASNPTLYAHPGNVWAPLTSANDTTVDLPLADSPTQAAYTNTYPSPGAGTCSCTVAAGAFVVTSQTGYNMAIYLAAGTGLTQTNNGDTADTSESDITVQAQWYLGGGLPAGNQLFQFAGGGVAAPGGFTRVIIAVTLFDIKPNGTATPIPIPTPITFNQKFPPGTFNYLFNQNVYIGAALPTGDKYEILGKITFKAVGG